MNRPDGLRLLIPAYIPTHLEFAWDELLADLQPGDIVIANPNNGPGTTNDPGWARRMTECRTRGAVIAGYTPLGYGNPYRLGPAFIDMARWRTLYRPELAFLDEFPGRADDTFARGGHPTYLAAAVLMARRHAHPRLDSSTAASQLVIANPGTTPDKRWTDQLPRVGIWVVNEQRDTNGGSVDDITPPPCPWLGPDRQAWLSYDDPDVERTLHRLAELGWKWAWSTKDPAPAGNPWDKDPNT